MVTDHELYIGQTLVLKAYLEREWKDLSEFEHCNYRNLIDMCSLVVHFPMWLLEFFICGGVITSTRTRIIVYRLHDQAEDEERKSLIH